MDVHGVLDRLERFPDALATWLGGLSAADATWRPASGGWSLVEIVNHLADEESEDFRARLRSTLEDPTRPWAPIDPERAVVERGHAARALEPSLARFAEERRASIAWLRALAEPPWSNTYEHPLGPLSAGDLLVSWAAHDALHLRQVASRVHALVSGALPGGSSAYAGPLTA